METCGVRTCGELARVSVATLQRLFGEDKGRWLAAMARGLDDDPVKDQSLVQSIGSGKKFEGPHKLKTLKVC
jgi:nucleotidyltransferase/DNA polymerase involved in DNA repair